MDIDRRKLLADMSEHRQIKIDAKFRMMPSLEQNLNSTNLCQLRQFLVDLLQRQDVMIVILFCAIESTEFAIDVADVGVVDIPINDIRYDFVPASVEGGLLGELTTHIGEGAQLIERKTVKGERILVGNAFATDHAIDDIIFGSDHDKEKRSQGLGLVQTAELRLVFREKGVVLDCFPQRNPAGSGRFIIVMIYSTKRSAFQLFSGCMLFFLTHGSALAQGDPAATPETATPQGPPQIDGVTWVTGPADAMMGSLAKIWVPKGYVFTDGAGTRRIMELMENFAGPSMQGMVTTPDLGWFVVFDFKDVGYVKDDEKDKLDADKMLAEMKSNDEAANEERRKRGWQEMYTAGWVRSPFYNDETKRIEWGLRVKGKEGESVNYLAKILGRRGVMEATLVTDPKILDPTLPQFTNLLTSFDFQGGERYAEYQQGDKLATMGLTALVTGGAVAIAAKSGLLQKFWKVIVIGVIAIAAFLKKILGGVFGRRDAA